MLLREAGFAQTVEHMLNHRWIAIEVGNGFADRLDRGGW
jgi:hypothetical protein